MAGEINKISYLLAEGYLRLLALLAVDESGSFVVEAVKTVWLFVDKVATSSIKALNQN